MCNKLPIQRYVGSIVLMLCSYSAYADISGTVFRDFNTNGVKDASGTLNEVGVLGITVSAYDSGGSVMKTTTSAADGTYTLGGVTGDVRIEFTGMPAYLYPGVAGTVANASKSSVQFVTAGAVTTVNYALSHPTEYCNATPSLITPRYNNGAVTGTGESNVLLSWPYTNTGTVTTGLVANASKADIGSVWGIAYKRSSKEVFTSTVLKRHVGVKNTDLGAVYKTDMNTNTTSLFINIPNGGTIGTDAVRGLGDSSAANADSSTLGEVMKVGLGDIDISDDEKYLYVTNLNDKKLYQVDIAQKSITNSYSIPNPCNAAKGNSRPFGLGVYQGSIYVGLVCDASVTGLKSDLETYVEKLNNDGSFTQVLRSSLDYTKEAAAQVNSGRNGWYGWSDDYNVISIIYGGTRRIIYPQPVLSDINFDKNGNMILGFIDRAGFQGGFENTSPVTMPTTGTGEFITINGGELLKATLNAGTWNLGLNDFYNDDSPVSDHQESAVGGVCYNALTDQVFTTSMDPTGNTHSGGTTNLNNATGARNSAYELYHQDNGKPDLFGKGGGLGDLELLCDPAPIEIGNRVWMDTNGDGIQNAGENGIPSVSVELRSGATILATSTTATDGSYYFSSATGASTASTIYGISSLQPNTTYTVKFPPSVTVSGTTYNLTTAIAGGNTLIDSNAPASGEVTVAAADIPTAGANNHSFDVGYALPTPKMTDLEVTKTANLSSVKSGDTVIYTVKVKNNGPDTATGVEVTDQLPTGVTYASHNAGQGAYTSGTGLWTVGTLANGATATLTITVTIK